jgi:hypothetical protein
MKKAHTDLLEKSFEQVVLATPHLKASAATRVNKVIQNYPCARAYRKLLTPA